MDEVFRDDCDKIKTCAYSNGVGCVIGAETCSRSWLAEEEATDKFFPIAP